MCHCCKTICRCYNPTIKTVIIFHCTCNFLNSFYTHWLIKFFLLEWLFLFHLFQRLHQHRNLQIFLLRLHYSLQFLIIVQPTLQIQMAQDYQFVIYHYLSKHIVMCSCLRWIVATPTWIKTSTRQRHDLKSFNFYILDICIYIYQKSGLVYRTIYTHTLNIHIPPFLLLHYN